MNRAFDIRELISRKRLLMDAQKKRENSIKRERKVDKMLCGCSNSVLPIIKLQFMFQLIEIYLHSEIEFSVSERNFIHIDWWDRSLRKFSVQNLWINENEWRRIDDFSYAN